MPKLIDLTGKRFGRLVVLRRCESDKRKWNCQCDCGNKTSVLTSQLTSGKTKSCGCYKKDLDSKRFKKHGDANKSKLYCVWAGMKNRCKNKSHIGYKDYGGKGIRYCEEWEDYSNFKNWAESNGYKEGLTIDRIDNNKNYCPENCRWVDRFVQANNMTKNHLLELDGEKHTIAEWSRITGIDQSVIKARVNRLGWSAEKTLKTPVRKLVKKE